MAQLTINGEIYNMDKPLTVRQLLIDLEHQPESVAVAVNLQFVPRSRFASQLLDDRDQVEILSAIQGG